MNTLPQNITRKTRLLCGSGRLKEVISIGDQFINDFPDSPAEKGRNGRCPLDVVLCEDCSLFQLRHTAPQELLYSRHYWYQSGINETIRNDLANIAELIVRKTKLQATDVALDIGANDGTLLSNLKGRAIRVGCEPAENLQTALKQNADHIISRFLDQGKLRQAERGQGQGQGFHRHRSVSAGGMGVVDVKQVVTPSGGRLIALSLALQAHGATSMRRSCYTARRSRVSRKIKGLRSDV